MDLSEFVASSIFDIAAGIADAIDRVEKKGIKARISPIFVDLPADWDKYIGSVEFDVAVSASSSVNAGGKAQVNVLGLVVGGEGGGKTETGSISRLKFSVPMTFPSQATNARK